MYRDDFWNWNLLRVKLILTFGLLAALTTTAIAAPPVAKPKPRAGDFEVRVKPSWVWVASVTGNNLTNATLALARASIPAVFAGTPVQQLYVRPDDAKRATSVLRKDASTKHYKINFGLDVKAVTHKAKNARKPSHK